VNHRTRRRPAPRVAALGIIVVACLLALAPAGWAEDDGAADGARRATRAFAEALTRGDASGLRPLLPERGKIQLHLERLGPEEGFFSAGQVEALFSDFLSQGAVRAFDLVRVEPDANGLALVHGKAVIIDRQGRSARIDLHLAFEPEDSRWVLRELREAP